MMKTYRKSFSLFIFALLFLTLLNNLNAQPQGFVQGRFVGIHDGGCPQPDAIVNCDAENDGALHFRLKQLGELGEEVFTDADNDEAVRFEVQFRAAIQDITYNAGEVFITSTGTQAFRQNLASACKISDEGVFKGNSNYSVSAPEHVSPNLMKVSVTATTNVDPAEVIELGKDTDYQTYAILECKIADTNADAGLALHAETYTSNSILVDVEGTPTRKVAFVMADNDLRGFRLDGKTWAEDYSLSDGADVIVKFSKGIKTQLTEEHFALLYTESNVIDTVESVVHSPGDDEVFISYMESDDVAILSISTNTAPILDNDDNPLAPGSFLAYLDSDPPGSPARFPNIGAITAHSTQKDHWCVVQNLRTTPPSFLRASVDKDDLCLADKFSYDCLEEDGQPFIVSVFADEYDADESPENICANQFSNGQYYITLVIDPITTQRKEQRNLELRFKRNTVLATDLQAFRERISLDSQITLADTIGPEITVMAMPRRVSADAGRYILNFTVTADEPVNNLNSETSYQLLRVLQNGSTVVDEDGFIENTSATDAYTVEVEARTFAPSDEEAENIFGYTLGYVAGRIQDRGTVVMNSPIDQAGEPLQDGDALDSNRQAIASIKALECASIYPHIGQKELFIELSGTAVNSDGFLIDGQPARQIEQIGNTTADGLSVFKVTLDEITLAPIAVAYHQTIGTTATATAHCRSSLTNDTDGDGTPDIADVDPFDADKTNVNTAVSSANPLSSAPGESSVWYSRDTVIRGLMRGENLTYMDMAPTLSAADYFGIEGANARVFRVSSDCQNILDASVANNLNKVKLDEFCMDVSDNFASEPTGSHQYAWVVISNGYLASDYRSYLNVRILPELSLSGQSSYLYASPTTQSITISLELSDTNMLPEVAVTRSDDLQPVPVPLVVDTEDVTRAEGKYDLPATGMYVGQTITHRFNAPLVWSPMSDNIKPTAGGHLLSSFDYSMYSYNQVDVRVAAADEPLDYLHQILLYDVSNAGNPEQVVSVVNGGKYTIVADFTTTVADIRAIESPMQVGYKAEDELIAVAPNSSFVGSESESFTFTVEATEGAITVGWDSIGDMEDVKARYLVTEMKQAVADSDGDRIPDNSDTQQGDNKKLHVAINGAVRGDEDALTTGDENSQLFISDAGLIIALGKGGDDAAHYSVANIHYDQLSAATIAALGLTETGFTTDNPIETIATFGIRDVAYAIGEDGETAVGGVTHTTFPVPVQSAQVGETLYLSKYDSGTQQWKAFERDNTARGYSDTWYVIARPDNDEPCPSDMDIYRSGHQAAGERHMGFVASAQNCIMLVIADGGPYDNGGLDGRVVDPLGIGQALAGGRGSSGSSGGGGGSVSGGGGGGGGGAIGGGTLLLLFVLLLSLIMTTRNHRRLSRYKQRV